MRSSGHRWQAWVCMHVGVCAYVGARMRVDRKGDEWSDRNLSPLANGCVGRTQEKVGGPCGGGGKLLTAGGRNDQCTLRVFRGLPEV
jgi:hypothetical protein